MLLISLAAKSSTTYTAGYQNASARPAGQSTNKTYNYPAAGGAQSYSYPNQAAAATANKSQYRRRGDWDMACECTLSP